MSEATSAPWVPYEETPKSMRCAMGARWVVSYPLQRTVGFGVTVGELILAVLFIAVIVFSAVSWETTRSGGFAQFPMLFAFVTAAKHSPLTFLLGIPFERRLAYHKLSAYMAIIAGVLHGVIAYAKDDTSDSGKHQWTGTVTVLCAVLMATTAYHVIRRKAFEVFYFLHVVLFTCIIVFLAMHGAIAVLGGVLLWFVDVMIRAVYTSCWQPSRCTLTHLSGTDIVRVDIEGMRYSPGQYAFLCFPEVGIFEWHPVSFSSAMCEGSTASFHLRCSSGWTKRLLELASGPEPKEHTVYVDGSYGSCSVDVESEKYEHFLFVAGGIGITPMRSIATSITEQGTRGRKVQLLETHWSVRDGVAKVIPMNAQHGLTMYRTGGNTEIEMGEVTPVEEKPWKVQHGRMNLEAVVEGFKGRVQQEGIRVAVLFCGPPAMLGPLTEACHKHSSSSVSFDLHSETFEF